MLLFVFFLMACKGGKPIHVDVVNSGATPNKIDMPIEPRIQPDRPLDIILGTRGDPTAAFVPRIVAKPNGRIGLNVEEPQADLDIKADTIAVTGSILKVPSDMVLRFPDNVSVPLRAAATALQEARFEVEQVPVKCDLFEATGEKDCIYRTRFVCPKGTAISVSCNPAWGKNIGWLREKEGGCSVLVTFYDVELRNLKCNANIQEMKQGFGVCLSLTTKTAVTH